MLTLNSENAGTESNMKTYLVKIPEVHKSIWRVEAESVEEAKEAALNGEGDMIEMTYSHTDLDSNDMEVEEEVAEG